MKKLTAFLFLFFCIANVMHSQSRLDSLKALGRDSLIKLAVKEIRTDRPEFNPANYDRITVKANQTTLLVEFDLSVRFVNSHSCYYDNYTIALYGSGTGGGVAGGGCEQVEYYNPSASDKKKIAFVFDAINKSDEIGHIPDNKMDPSSTMTITEKPTYYYVEVSDWSTFSHYEVDKGSGKISKAAHKHYDRSDEQPDEYVEIK